MKRPQDLTREELEKIAGYAQGFLFGELGEHGNVRWVQTKQVSGADFIDHMVAVLAECGMMPPLED